MPNHRLAAILFTDIVGYTAMMQTDQAKAMQAVKSYESALRSLITQHGGELLQTYGDGSLSVFDSASAAVRCAKELQEQVRDQVPLRIGIHLGEITIDGEHIFGDGVNIASRIESMGIAGAVLVSSSIRQQIKNKSEFELESLGKFSFKNVQKSMEVFALTNDGLTVPKRRELTGKQAPQKSNWLLIVGGIVFAVLCAITIFQFLFTDADNIDLQEKKVTILQFQNQTMDASMDAFGKMIADWLTKGLIEIEETKVISATNIQQQLKTAGLTQMGAIDNLAHGEFAPKLRQSTGLDIIVEGNYYLLGDSIIINSKILDIEKGEYLKIFENHGTKGQIKDLLDELTQQFLGYWATQKTNRFAQNPPKYEAYKEYLKGKAVYIAEPDQAVIHFQKAYQLDSTFFAPLFDLLGLYAKEGEYEKGEEVGILLEQLYPSFSNWENLQFNALKAAHNNDWLLAAQMSEKLYRLDMSDAGTYLRVVNYYNNANRPGKALAIIKQVDKRFLQAENVIVWTPVVEVFTNFRLGNYEEVIRIAKQYTLPKTPDALAIMHLKSLAHVDSLDRLREEYEAYKEKGIYTTSGNVTPKGQFIPLVCDELLLTDNIEVLQEFAQELENWAHQNENQPTYYRNLGFAHFYQGDYAKALEAWKKEQVYDKNWPGWMRFPLEIEYQSRLGYCYAALGDSTNAQEKIKQILSEEGELRDISGIQNYYQARILAKLGKKEEALTCLENSVKHGFTFFRPAVFDTDPFLKPLYGFKAFEDFLTPKS